VSKTLWYLYRQESVSFSDKKDIKRQSREMPVKYSQEFQVPKEFPEVLRNLTREILRQQPPDINKFGEYQSIA